MVAADVKSDRCQRLASLERELRERYFRSLLGRKLTVLVEGSSETHSGGWAGTSCRYAPVEIGPGETVPGSLVDATAQQLSACGSRIEAAGTS